MTTRRERDAKTDTAPSTAPTRSASWRGWRPSASGPRCTSAPPASRACTTSSTRSSTTRSTRRSPGYCTEINVTIHIDNSVTVVDNGRGIPVGRTPPCRACRRGRGRAHQAPRRAASSTRSAYKVSGGLHGVGRLGGERALARPSRSRSGATARSTASRYARGDPAGPAREHGRHRPPRHQGHLQARRPDLRDHDLQLRHALAAPARAVAS